MRRAVSARLSLRVAGTARLALAVALAAETPSRERLSVTRDAKPCVPQELLDRHGTRLHILDLEAGELEVEYSAEVDGLAPVPALDPIDHWRYLRPSRYCESDALRPVAVAEFDGLDGVDLLDAVSSWVGVHIAYVPGSSLPTDGALQTYIDRRGVCRDFAHLVVALLRALDVPARVVSVYAPGLDPMDFHAVAEAVVDGAWHVVDATALAPRSALLRIATGRDAADIAFVTSHGAEVRLDRIEVTAVADRLPDDDLSRLAVLR